jgi:hypothetical protein
MEASVVRKLYLSVVLSAILALSSLPLRTQASSPEVKTESKPHYIPAGPGQTPWNVTRHVIPLKDIQSGGPPRDGIPALNFPAFISAGQGDRTLKPSDTVLGIEMDGQAKAYPVRILNWHEVVNDEIAGQPVLVSW